MLDRIGEMELNDISYTGIICSIKNPKKESKIHYDFLIWEYGKHHLKQSDNDRLYCCTFVFGDKYKNSNQENSYIMCLTCFYFFQNKVFPFLIMLMTKYFLITWMIFFHDGFSPVVPNISNSVTHYSLHRICANVQFSSVEKFVQSTKTYPSIVYMVPDHNQEVFHMRYHEGHIYYFGKKGMSMLVMMEVRW